jgi:hypothetical protein
MKNLFNNSSSVNIFDNLTLWMRESLHIDEWQDAAMDRMERLKDTGWVGNHTFQVLVEWPE